ncbi:MAG: RNA polymerase sigma factor [Planctomycetota bacterium]
MTQNEKNLVPDEDAFLMVEFQKGSKSAFATLFTKYQQMVVNVITRYIGDNVFAEDMAQEVFLRIYKAKNKYKPVTQFKYYLFTIVHNLCLNEIRDTIRRKTKSMDFSEESFSGRPCARGRSAFGGDDKLCPEVNSEPIENSENMEIRQDVKSAIESLPPQQRIAVILDKYEGLSYEEIGKVMKLSVSAVKSILWRAREGLKEKLKKYI